MFGKYVLRLYHRPGTVVGTADMVLPQGVKVLPLGSSQSGKETFLEPTFPCYFTMSPMF